MRKLGLIQALTAVSAISSLVLIKDLWDYFLPTNAEKKTWKNFYNEKMIFFERYRDKQIPLFSNSQNDLNQVKNELEPFLSEASKLQLREAINNL